MCVQLNEIPSITNYTIDPPPYCAMYKVTARLAHTNKLGNIWLHRRLLAPILPLIQCFGARTQKPNTVIHLMKNDMCNRWDHMHLL